MQFWKTFKFLLNILLLGHFCNSLDLPVSLKEFLSAQNSDIEKSEVMEKLVMGSLGNYLTLPEIEEIMNAIVADYSNDLVYKYKVGESYEGRTIMSYVFMTGTS